MSQGTGIIYAGGSKVFEALVAIGARHGLTLANPSSGRTTLLSAEEGKEGMQVAVDQQHLTQVVARLRVGERVTFQLWLSPDVDVVTCAECVLQGVTAYRFSFDGLSAGGGQIVARMIAELMVEPDTEPLGLVIDRTGMGADVDWDAVISDRIQTRVRMHADVFLAP